MNARFPLVAGALGFRDLGGLAGTRTGRVFAGGRRELITGEGIASLHHLGVGHILDLRTPAEVTRRPSDPPLAPAAWAGIQIHNRPVEDFSDAQYQRALGHPFLNHPGQYPLLLNHFPTLVAGAMEQLAELATTPEAIYIHCSAGRDRTGLVSSWLWQLAHVPHEAITAEYVRTLSVVNEHHRTSGHPVEYFMAADEFAAWAGERAQALAEFLAAYPAADTLHDLGLACTDIDRLRTLLAAG